MRHPRREWELADAFASARYWLPAPEKGIALTFESSARGEGRSARLSELLPRGTWAIVSASNPWSVSHSVEENEILASAMRRDLSARVAAFRSMRNTAADGRWEEGSFLLEGMTREPVLELCWRFGQVAAVWGIGTRCGLLWTRSERWVMLPPQLVQA